MSQPGVGEGASVDPVKEDFKTARRRLDAGDVEPAKRAVTAIAKAISGRVENDASSDDPDAYTLQRVVIANELGTKKVRYLLAPPEQVATERNLSMVYVDIAASESHGTDVQYLSADRSTNPYYQHADTYTTSLNPIPRGDPAEIMDTVGGIYDDIAAHGVRKENFTVAREGDVGDFIDKFPFSKDLEPSTPDELQSQHDNVISDVRERPGTESHRRRRHTLPPAEPERPALDRTAWSAVTDRAVEALGTNHEELANFLQGFADIADSTTIGYGQSNDYEMMEYCGPFQEWVRFVDDAGSGQDRYALLRGDMMARRRPQAPDESYTVVNMRTGDELHFTYSDIEHIRQGVYVREIPTKEPLYNEQYGRFDAVDATRRRVIDPPLIATVAGITEPYDDTDPIIKLTKGRESPEGVILDATFKTKEQIDRFTRLVSLNETACVNARTTFEPANAEELIKFASTPGSDWIAPHIQTVVVPEGTTPLVLDKEHQFALGSLMDTVSHWDSDTQRAIYRSIQSVDISALGDAWAQGNNIRRLVENSIRFGDGSYTVEPSTVLTGRLLCDQYDFLEAVYHAANGMWVESSTQKWGEPKATRNPPRESLDEYKAEVYAKIFGWRLMNSVDAAREAYQIPDDIPDEEQIVMLLKRHGYTEKGMRLSMKEHILAAHHNITVPQWGQICMIIDRCREAPIEDQDRAIIERFGFAPDAIGRYLERGPGSTSEQIAEQLARRRELT